jgi:hypothetical protein
LILGVVLLFAAGAATARASGDPYADQAEKIPCPAAPSGWFLLPAATGGRTVLTPLTAVAGGPSDPTTFFGAPVVQVDCHYMTHAGKDFDVAVRYVLPMDLNPWNDFYIGCTSTGHPQNEATSAKTWNDKDRIYRIVGAKTWSLATFIDDLKQLTAADVPRFEAIARSMLQNAQPFAHNCKLAGNGKPTEVKALWTFSFDAQTSQSGVTSSGGTTGSFTTTPENAGPGIGAIGNLQANDFRLKVSGKGPKGSLEIHVGTPIDFHHGYGAVLRAHIMVLASNEAGCAKGATGQLKLSVQYLTAPSVAVQICGHTYLAGKGSVRAQMKTV